MKEESSSTTESTELKGICRNAKSHSASTARATATKQQYARSHHDVESVRKTTKPKSAGTARDWNVYIAKVNMKPGTRNALGASKNSCRKKQQEKQFPPSTLNHARNPHRT